MTLVIATICLIIIEWLYIKVARRLGIVAEVSSRSSHTRTTPTAGGIVYVLAACAFAAENSTGLPSVWWWTLGGGLILSAVSMWDDIHPLPPMPRLLIQILVVCLAFKTYCYPQALHIYVLTVICCICCINAFNFIDGIRCMLAFYSLTVLMTLIWAAELYAPEQSGEMVILCQWMLAATIAFICFNAGDRVFAGDVGAITLGYYIAFILVSLIVSTKDASLFILIVVALFDTCMTVLQRLFAGYNILLPHRMNVYQVLTSKWGLPHHAVSGAYAVIQLVISAAYFAIPVTFHWFYTIMVIGILTVIYFTIRRSPRSA